MTALSLTMRLFGLFPAPLRNAMERQMALTSALGRLWQASVTKEITTHILRLPPSGSDREIAVGFDGVTADEARALIDFAIKLEQARTGDVLTPTEYGNRFSGLDLTDPE